ncbi:MAG: hypothetical protein H0U49_06780 [Parachlamydiaceae bacterium]|nr:hypothetical protein [Parachlamydiaceae bacterium]
MMHITKTVSRWISAILMGCTPFCSAMIISEHPSVISGPQSGLQRPEGISFSPSGNCMAIADSECNAILFYKYTGNAKHPFEKIPSSEIKDNDLLNYVHDLEYSPGGEFIGAVSRETNTVVIYKKKEHDPIEFEENNFWHMRGSASKLDNPASLSFSSNGKVLAVCNRMGGSGITFYSQVEDSEGEYSPIPFQSISERSLLKHNISAPHGIAFSPDGKTMSVVHKPFYKDTERLGKEAVAIFELAENPHPVINSTPIFFKLLGNKCLHSVAFHPSGKYFATVAEEGWVVIYKKVNDTGEFVVVKILDVLRKDNKYLSPKGIDFSPNGNYLAITLETPAIYIYEISGY